MNHMPFENWLIDDSNLSIEQKMLLQDHLRDCRACSELKESWFHVNQVLKTRRMATPDGNFVKRWNTYKLERHAEAHRRVNRLLLIFSGLALLSFSIFTINFAEAGALKDWFNTTINTITGIFHWLDQIQQAIFSVLALFPSFISMILMFLTVSTIFSMGVFRIWSLWNVNHHEEPEK